MKAFIGIGSNVDAEKNIPAALEMLRSRFRVTRLSSAYRTQFVGGRGNPDVINLVAEIETGLSPAEVMTELRRIEDALHRDRSTFGLRTMDLDLLLCGDRVMQTAALTLPHAEAANRAFVLVPLAEIAPKAMHPVSKKTAQQLLDELPATEKAGVLEKVPLPL